MKTIVRTLRLVVVFALTLASVALAASRPASTTIPPNNPAQVAILRWYAYNATTTFATPGPGAWGLAFDGANMWVTSVSNNNVTKIRACDGTILGSFTVGNQPGGIAFDGANLWVANGADGTVSKVRASDGVVLGTFMVGFGPYGVAFDGANIWVTNRFSNSISKLRASDGTLLATYGEGALPTDILFDGTFI